MAIVSPTQVKPGSAVSDGSPLNGVKVGAVHPRITTGGTGITGWNLANMPGGSIAQGAGLTSGNQVNVSGYQTFYVVISTSVILAATSNLWLGITTYDPITQVAMHQEPAIMFPESSTTWATQVGLGSITNVTDINRATNNNKSVIAFGRGTSNLSNRVFTVIGLTIINNTGVSVGFNAISFWASA
jgi:hypothetical protein